MGVRRQDGSLQKRKRAGVWKWMGLWWENGSRKAKTIGLCTKMTKADAQGELDKITQRINEQTGTVEYTLQGYARGVVFPWYRRSWKPSTAYTTVERIDHHVLKELGNKKLSTFNRDTLQNHLDKLATRDLSQATLSHLRWDLRQLFRMAVNDGLMPRNPAELLHTPKGTRKERRVLTLGQLTIILTALHTRERLIIKLAGICGMRPGEIVGLQWSDVHNDGLRITRGIYRGVVQSPKTHHSVRTVALPTSVNEDLKLWRTIAPNTAPEDWIFPTGNGKTPLWANNLLYDHIRPVLKPLGLEWVNYQVLRRTAVTLLNEGGSDPTIIAAQLGHTIDVSLNTYNKVGIQRQQNAVQTLDNALHPATLSPTVAHLPS